jgi:hypothetical protein
MTDSVDTEDCGVQVFDVIMDDGGIIRWMPAPLVPSDAAVITLNGPNSIPFVPKHSSCIPALM